MQPGQTITPTGTDEPSEQTLHIDQQPAQPAPVPEAVQLPSPAPIQQVMVPIVAAAPTQPTAPLPQPAPQPVAYAQPEPARPTQATAAYDDNPGISWSASEYIDHPKDSGWFVMFGLGLAALVIVIYFVTKDLVAPILIGVAGLSFGAFAARQPKALNYQLTNEGIGIADKFYVYADFKSFSVMDEGAFQSVLLTPLKRFMPPITIYYDPKDEENILNTLSDYLPHEDREHDLTDQLMKRMRF